MCTPFDTVPECDKQTDEHNCYAVSYAAARKKIHPYPHLTGLEKSLD